VYVCVGVCVGACMCVCVCVYVFVLICVSVCMCVCGCIFFIYIQHAPLHSNTTCFWVKYSQHGYVRIFTIHVQLLLFSIDTVSLLLVFLCIAFNLLSTALLTK